MAQTYFIDGYNLLLHAPELKRLANRDLESARETFINMIIPWCMNSGEQVNIIFDGQGRRTEKAESEHVAPNLNVIYTSGNTTADAIIERAVFKSQQRMSVIVVSADRGIVDLCMGMGALIMSPANFWTQIQESDQQVERKIASSKENSSLNRMEDRLGSDAMDKLKKLRDSLDD
ncbi:MAG: hypothetical protein COA73_11025 [Candidatus Hydrogenedentota bacterium]|nr:MAG: hypothetical protein COA73_11025 [Candidatus Hydrogenedentota bacterium]